MQILLLAATQVEIKDVKPPEGTDVLIAGVGIPSTIYHLLKQIGKKKYDLVVQAGIGGCFNNKFDLAEVVLISKDTFADIGVEENGKFNTIADMDLLDPNSFPFNDGWLENKNELLNSIKLEKAIGATINKLRDRMQQKGHLTDRFPSADIESMEGAALHYICLMENIPFTQLRAISNEVGVRDKKQWKMEEAISNLNNELKKLLQLLTK